MLLPLGQHFVGNIRLTESFELEALLDKLIRIIPFLIKNMKESNLKK